MHESNQKNKTNTKTLLYRRQLNKIRKSMRSKKQDYQKTKKRKISQRYKRRETILQEAF